MNYLKTAILLAGMTALFMAIGAAFGGQQEADERTAPELHQIVRELSQRAGLPMPKVYLMDNPQPNAFATGRNPENAAVAATTGLLQMLSRDEVAGVMAHELAHVKNRDTLIMTITATIAGAISMVANFGMLFGGNMEYLGPMALFGGTGAAYFFGVWIGLIVTGAEGFRASSTSVT